VGFRRGSNNTVALQRDIVELFVTGQRPRLEIDHTVEGGATFSGGGRKTEYTKYVMVGIANRGKVTAGHPKMTLTVHRPYTVSSYGLGNMKHGLPLLETRDSGQTKVFGADVDVIVHPDDHVLVTRIPVKFQEGTSSLSDVVFDYTLMAENTEPVQGTASVPGGSILASAGGS